MIIELNTYHHKKNFAKTSHQTKKNTTNKPKTHEISTKTTTTQPQKKRL